MLVSIGANTRPVSFSIIEPSAVANMEALVQAVRFTFKDILKPGQEFYLQLKSGGAFVDLLDRQSIADRSVLKAVLKPDIEVSWQTVQFSVHMHDRCFYLADPT